MQTNFLEELVAEWLEYKGYIVKRNERVGRRAAGGHEGELDVVAFNPKTNHLIHVETSTDADSWAGRIRKWKKIKEEGKFLRVILLPDGETVHNAFFDRGFKGEEK